MTGGNFTPFISENVFVRYSSAHRSLMSHLLLEDKIEERASTSSGDQTPSSKRSKNANDVDTMHDSQQYIKSKTSPQLSAEDHSFYLSMLLHSKENARLLHPSVSQKLILKESADTKKRIYQLHAKVVQEQTSFLKIAEKNSLHTPLFLHLQPVINQFTKEYLDASSERALGYPRRYQAKDQVPLMLNSPTRSTFIYINTILQMGVVPCLFLPKISGRTVVSQGYQNILMRYPLAKSSNYGDLLLKTPVSQDSNADKLARKYDVQIVISSSSLKTLFANSHRCLENTWDVPVIVRDIPSAEGGPSVHKIVNVDKAFPSRDADILEYYLAYQKRALKTKLLHPKHMKASRFTTASINDSKAVDVVSTVVVGKPNENSDQSRVADAATKLSDAEDSMDDDELVIDWDDATPSATSSEKLNSNNFQDNQKDLEMPNKDVADVPQTVRRSLRIQEQSNAVSSGRCERPNESIFGGKSNKTGPIVNVASNKRATSPMKVPPTMPTTTLDEIERLQTELLGDCRKAEREEERRPILKENEDDYLQPHGNVTYQLWELGRLRVLVRCSVDGATKVDGKTVYWKVQPKLEYRPTIGGEALTYTECAKQWIGTAVRPDCKLARVRINAFTNNVVGLEEMDCQQIPLPSTGFNPSDCLNVLNAIFQRLLLLPEGSYFLSHNCGEGVVVILKEATVDGGSPSKNVYDLHADQKSAAATVDRRETLEVGIAWRSIDPTVMLFSHLQSNRIPATFDGNIRNSRQYNRKKKKQKK